ncbi:MAG: type I polyketide synthase [Armatimonadota bacterium]
MSPSEAESLKRAAAALSQMRERLERLEQRERDRREPIAVIGIGCRFPGGAEGPDRFWGLLREGRDAVTVVPSDRWDIDAYYDPDPDRPGKICSRRGAFLQEVDRFDAELFGIAPREAAGMDPQQRLVLETTWEALENACLVPDRLAGTRTGVFVAANSNEYYQLALEAPDRIDAYTVSGGAASVCAGRLSYVLDLRGPSCVVDTACSSSLMAVHRAVQSLRAGECGAALAAGVYTVLTPALSMGLSRARMLSPEGRCKAFDASADGFVQGEGCGVVVLKRLSDARAAGDRILGVIRGSAANQDGRSGGLTAPSAAAQEAVVRQALADAGAEPGQVGYVEAHGTGTALGDPIEVRALAAVFGPGRRHPLVLGSVKTNLGHTGPAAGITGLIKVLLSLQHRQIPPHLHFQKLNPYIETGELPLRIPTSLIDWESAEGRRLAGVSSFGFSGTNVHVVVEEAPVAPDRPAPAAERPLHLLCFSAPTEAALRQLARRYAEHFAEREVSLPDAAYSAHTGRSAFRCRAALIARDAAEAGQLLLRIAAGQPTAEVLSGGDLPGDGARCHAALEETGRRWLGGETVDWDAYDHGHARRKVSLPTYPFQRERYWLEPIPTRPARPSGLPPWGRRIPSPLAERLYEARLGLETHPYLADHRVFGAVVVAGAVHIALMLEALRDGGEAAPVRLAELRFDAPLLLDSAEPRAVQVVVSPEGHCRVFSQQAEVWTLHASALACRVAPEAATVAAVDGGLLTAETSGAEWVRELERRGIGIGPAFQGIRRMRRGEQVAEAEVSLPGHLAGEGWSFHPALLDACLQTAGGALGPETAGATFLPVGIDRLDFISSPQGPLTCRAVLRPASDDATHRADLSLHDSTGSCVAVVSGLAFKAVARGAVASSPAVDDLLYRLDWEARPLEVVPDAAAKRLFVTDALELGERLAAELEGECVLALPGAELRTAAPGRYEVDLTDPAQLRALLQAASGYGEVLYFTRACEWSLDEAGSRAWSGLLSLAQALAELPAPPRLTLLTRGAARETPSPTAALLRGFASALAAECPALRCRRIDLDPAGDPLRSLCREIETGDEAEVALRGEERLVPRLVRCPAEPRVEIRFEGTVLITGGLGGLGLETARWAVARGARHLLLAGRSAPSPAAEAVLHELRERGADVRAAQADVRREDDVRRLLSGEDGLPPLRGIIHAAGVTADGLIGDLTPERFEEALAAKARGAWLLHQHSRGMALDFFILFSSIASFIGATGQTSYAAANGYLDGLARHRRSLGLPALSLNWGRWAGSGMAERLDESGRQRLEALGLRAMAPESCLAALDAALARSEPQLAVVDLDWKRFLERYSAGTAPRLFERLHEETAGSRLDSEEDLADRLRAADKEERATLAVEYVAGAARRVLGLRAGRALDPAAPLIQLGLDSLMGVELRNRINTCLGIELPLAPFLSGGTTGSIAELVLAQLEEGAADWEVFTV